MIESLDDIDLTGVEKVPVTDSCRLHGPPGTGKTTESAGRVGRLIEDHGYALGDVAWATYRRALASDTLDRLNRWDVIPDELLETKLSEGSTRYIGTFHALGNRTIGDIGDPATAHDRVDFCEENDIRYKSRERFADGPGERLFACFGWLQNNLLDPTDPNDVRAYSGWDEMMDNWTAEAIGRMWTEWEHYRAANDLCDFYEMLSEPLNRGKAPPCDVVVIDEYHDATPLMANLAELWVENAEIAIVAGDPHQVINGFDGATPEFFDRLDLPRILLDQSYRVPTEHLALAFSILSNAHDPPSVSPVGAGMIREYRSPLFTPGSGGSWDVPGPTEKASPALIHGQHPGSTMFLTRTRMMADGVACALDRAGVPYRTLSDMAGWGEGSDRFELYNALASLTPFDRSVAGSGSPDGGGLLEYGSSGGADPENTRIRGPAAAKLVRTLPSDYIAADRDEVKKAAAGWDRLDTNDPTVSELTPLVEPDFWSAFTAGAASIDRLPASTFDSRGRMALKAMFNANGDPISPDEVSAMVLTVHASKGMEADDVVVFDGVTPRIRREIDRSERAARNEARTWYVACTRAEKRLHIMRDAFSFLSPYIPTNLELAVGDYTAALGD